MNTFDIAAWVKKEGFEKYLVAFQKLETPWTEDKILFMDAPAWVVTQALESFQSKHKPASPKSDSSPMIFALPEYKPVLPPSEFKNETDRAEFVRLMMYFKNEHKNHPEVATLRFDGETNVVKVIYDGSTTPINLPESFLCIKTESKQSPRTLAESVSALQETLDSTLNAILPSVPRRIIFDYANDGEKETLPAAVKQLLQSIKCEHFAVLNSAKLANIDSLRKATLEKLKAIGVPLGCAKKIVNKLKV